MSRTKNATRNLMFGVLSKAQQIFIPFLMRTIMIYFLGIQYLGLNSLFTSVLSVLNLAELGVGSAMVFSMYKPIAENDKTTICALMRLYRIYYRIIGAVILVAGLCLLPFIPKLIKGPVPPDMNVYILYLLNLLTTVFTYWLFAYKNSILTAHQRRDIRSKISLTTMMIRYGLQIVAIIFLRSYYDYIMVALLTQIASNIITAIISNKMYPDFHPAGKLPKEEVKQINQRIRDVFTAKLGGTITNSADTIVISAFLGLSILAMYQNYYFIMNSVLGFIMIIFTASKASIGNSIVTESVDKNFFDYRRMTFLLLWLSTICICCFMCMYQPFMKLWMGEKRMLGIDIVILLCMYFFVYLLNQLSCVYKDAAGIWHQDRFRPLISGLANLALNLATVRWLGLYAIVLSTVVSYIFVCMPWLYYNLSKVLFKRSMKSYVFEVIRGAISIAVIAGICYGICRFIPLDGILKLAANGMVAVIVSNVMFYMFYRKNELFNPTIDLFEYITGGKFNGILDKLKLTGFVKENAK